MKRCTKCGEEKELGAFYNDKKSKDGKTHNCKECMDAKTRETYARRHPKFVRYMGDLKVCRKCLIPKPTTSYNEHRYTKDGFRNECRECQKEHSREHYKSLDANENRRKRKEWYGNNKGKAHGHHLKRKFDISHEEYQVILLSQGGKCAICGTDKPGGKYVNFPVDHDHLTGRIRGLLCSPCNTGMGHFKDSPELLQKAIEYLNL